jgi:opacity protein-like surface antigen
MNALALALALAWGPDFEEDRLPRSLSDAYVLPDEAPDKAGREILLGGHLGVVDAVDGDGPGLVVGFEWRIHMLPWLGACGSIDYQSRQQVDQAPGNHFFQVPLMWSLLFYPPVDLGPLRLYGQVGTGFTVTNVSGSSVRTGTDVNFLGFLGVGAEFQLSSNLWLDANARFVSAKPPPNTGDFNADWAQFTVGVFYNLGK